MGFYAVTLRFDLSPITKVDSYQMRISKQPADSLADPSKPKNFVQRV